MHGDPHDRFAKFVFRRAAQAKTLLRGFLSREIQACLDLESIVRAPEGFVDASLRERIADVVLQVTTDSGGTVYVLMEHQRKVDYTMLARLGQAAGRIWECACGGRASDLPFVIPMVLFNGLTAWTARTRLRAGFDPRMLAAAAEAPSFSYSVLDLRRLEDEAIREAVGGDPMVALSLLALKHAGTTGIAQKLASWSDLVRGVLSQRHGLTNLGAVLLYLSRTSSLDWASFRDLVRKEIAGMAREDADPIITLADRLERVGHWKGRRLGREEGRAEALREALMTALATRFGAVSPAVANQICQAGADELGILLRRALTVDDAAELFEGR